MPMGLNIRRIRCIWRASRNKRGIESDPKGRISLKIALFSSDSRGGAGRATLRLHDGFRKIGQDSTLFLKWKLTDKPGVVAVQSPEVNNRLFEKCVINHFFKNVHEGNTISSAMYPSVGFDYLNMINEFNIVSLHWLPTFISLEAIARMNEMNKPLVWTLHDQNPMTGACHYTHGCEKYQQDCSGCQQLKSNPNDITKVILSAKIKHTPKELVVVTPSHWLADCARKSAVFRNHRIEVIPNSLETDVYIPLQKAEAKKRLGIAPNTRVILFGAQDLKERRKGFEELCQSVKYLQNIKEAAPLLEKGELLALTFGYSSPMMDEIGIPYKGLGYVDNDEELAVAYSAADVLALPSLEDNLPNVMLESMACGTPIVAYEAGGIVDAIENGKNGYVVPWRDTLQFAKRIIEVICGNPMSSYCRSYAIKHYQLEIQAIAYQELFHELIKKRGKISTAVPKVIPVIYPEIAVYMAPLLCDTAIEDQTEWERLTGERDALIRERDALIREQDALKSSKSWKLTMPLRVCWQLLKKILSVGNWK